MTTIREQAKIDATSLYTAAKRASWILQCCIWGAGSIVLIHGISLLTNDLAFSSGLWLILAGVSSTAISSVVASVWTRGALVNAQAMRAQLALLDDAAEE